MLIVPFTPCKKAEWAGHFREKFLVPTLTDILALFNLGWMQSSQVIVRRYVMFVSYENGSVLDMEVMYSYICYYLPW
jgi:hypothetical protein